MTDAALLLRAILDNPGEDAPRLIYSDYLEEHGDAGGRARSEFIRVQCELARLYPGWQGEPATDSLLSSGPYAVLRRRETELLTLQNAVRWTPNHKAFAAMEHIEFRRGFVSSIRCRLKAWLAHGPQILSLAPLWPEASAVRLSDREPNEDHGNGWGWHRWIDDYGPTDTSPAYEIPPPVWDMMKEEPVQHYINWRYYPTPAAAHAALSVAALAWARAAGGPCPRCKGKRDWHDALTGDGRCYDCRGTGKASSLVPCPRCEGDAVVQLRQPPGWIKVPCPDCRGTGRVRA